MEDAAHYGRAGRIFVAIGGAYGFLGVAFGAFGAHILEDKISARWLQVYETGVRYHLIHALALLAVAILLGQIGPSRLLKTSGWLFTVGILLFSGSLYAMALTGIVVLGAITPIGGLCFLGGWACLAIAALRSGREHAPSE